VCVCVCVFVCVCVESRCAAYYTGRSSPRMDSIRLDRSGRECHFPTHYFFATRYVLSRRKPSRRKPRMSNIPISALLSSNQAELEKNCACAHQKQNDSRSYLVVLQNCTWTSDITFLLQVRSMKPLLLLVNLKTRNFRGKSLDSRCTDTN
jgi:hypothetical protein